MIISPQKSGKTAVVNITVTVTRDVDVISNFMMAVILLAIFPIYYFKRKDGFEKDRWYNSNYSPYEYDDEDE